MHSRIIFFYYIYLDCDYKNDEKKSTAVPIQPIYLHKFAESFHFPAYQSHFLCLVPHNISDEITVFIPYQFIG